MVVINVARMLHCTLDATAAAVSSTVYRGRMRFVKPSRPSVVTAKGSRKRTCALAPEMQVVM